MRLGIIALSLFAVTLSSSAYAKVKAVSLRDQQQAACYDDVVKLCGDAMPSEEKVTACMEGKKSMVSPKCAAMWDVK